MMMLLKDYKIEWENNMAIEKISMFSSAINSGLLEAGHRSGFDVALAGAGLGAAGGAINGSFSDYEGVFSGYLVWFVHSKKIFWFPAEKMAALYQIHKSFKVDDVPGFGIEIQHRTVRGKPKFSCLLTDIEKGG